MDYTEYLEIVKKQEQLLMFSHFNRRDVWQLGNIFVEEIEKRKAPVLVSIRGANGFILFQYACEGTSLNNDRWMTRKFNLVQETEKSSLRSCIEIHIKGETLVTQGRELANYIACGGGFPVHIRDSGFAGAVIVSGFPHMEDHALLVSCIGRYLGVSAVPQLPGDLVIPYF
jgi:uncharacterized protein (UPF0303 family)